MKRILLESGEKKSLSIRRYTLLLVLGLQVATVAAILGISHWSFEKDLDEQSDLILQKAVAETESHTRNFLQPAYRTASLTASLFEQGLLDKGDRSSIERYFLGVLANNAEVTGLYVAGLRGDFLFVSRNKRFEDSSFLTKTILADKPGVADFVWRDEQHVQRHSEPEKADSYKANTRPWYIEAMAKQGPVWTNPYTFFTSQKPGITIALPYKNTNGVVEGVIGFDIELTSLAQFFSQLKVYGSISGFLVFNEDTFIGAPLQDDSGKPLQVLKKVQAANITESLDNFAARMLLGQAAVANPVQGSSRFQFSDSNYMIRNKSFSIDNGPVWVIGAYAPGKSFLEKLENKELRNIMLALAVLLGSMLLGLVMIRRTWRPFHKLFNQVVEDEMTGLYNRRFLESVGANFFNRAVQENGTGVIIAMLDIDNFNQINSEYGTTVGDNAILKFTDFIRDSLGSDALLTRYGGDTFVVIFAGDDADYVVALLNSIRLKLDAWPLAIEKLLVRMTFSAGVVSIKPDTAVNNRFNQHIHTAAKALQVAKLNGKDRVVYLDQNKEQRQDVFDFEQKGIA